MALPGLSTETGVRKRKRRPRVVEGAWGGIARDPLSRTSIKPNKRDNHFITINHSDLRSGETTP